MYTIAEAKMKKKSGFNINAELDQMVMQIKDYESSVSSISSYIYICAHTNTRKNKKYSIVKD